MCGSSSRDNSLCGVSGHNGHKPKRPKPKRPQTERPHAKTATDLKSTSRNGHKPQWPQTETATKRDGHNPERPQTETAINYQYMLYRQLKNKIKEH